MENINNLLQLKNWGLMRVLRMGLVIMIFFQVADTHDWWMLAIAAILLYQVVSNKGCNSCATDSCEVPKTTLKKDNTGEQ